jgi:TctA family transporter
MVSIRVNRPISGMFMISSITLAISRAAMFTEQPDIVWGLIAALLIANVMLLIMNIPLIGLFPTISNRSKVVLCTA